MPEAAQTGQIVEKTTRTRVLPTTESQMPEFWPYIEALKLPDSDHILYLYLQRENRNIPYGSYTSHIKLHNGKEIPIYDREACESGIQTRFGGGVWRLILKRGRQRQTETRVYTGDGPTAAPPVNVEAESAPGPIPVPNQNDASAQIANKAIDTIAGQDHQAVRIGIEALSSAANIMRNFGAGNGALGGDELTRQMLQVMIQRMLQPPPDPIELLAKVLSIQSQMNPQSNGNPMTNKLLETAIERFLNPVAAGPAISAGAELVRSLPSIGSSIVDGLREWRMGMEAQRDGVAIMRNSPPAPGTSVATTAAIPPAQVLPPRPNPPNGANAVPEGPSIEFVETRMLELIRQPMSSEEAAERALEFLHTVDGENAKPETSLVEQLASQGETGLLRLFQMRPILKPATANMPRLVDFIRALLKYYAEDKAEEGKLANEHKPN